LFLPISRVLISTFVCVSGAYEITLKSDNNIVCYEGIHNIYILCATIGLASFLPTAILLRPVWQQIQSDLDILYKPKYLISHIYIILIYLILTSFITLKWLYVLISFIEILILLILQIIIKPCNLEKVNYWRIITLICTMSTVICSFISLILNNTDNDIPAILLYSALVTILLISYSIFKRKYPTKISERARKLLELTTIEKSQEEIK